MAKRFRIDFTVRELDVPIEDARGITFGDDVPSEQIADFFNKCRDVARTLFVPGPSANIVKTPMLPGMASSQSAAAKQYAQCHSERQQLMIKHNIQPYPGDDGSRGGDGPISDDAEMWYKAQIDILCDKR